MDFPLPVRSVSSVDYFTPLHVDTNIEYSLDMGKFPEMNDPFHHWEPALAIATESYYTTDHLETRSEMASPSERDQSQLDNLIDTYRIDDLQMDSVDFGFVDLPASSLQSLLDSTESFLELSDSVLPVTNYNDESLHFLEDSVEYFHKPVRQSKRKQEDAFSSTSIERQMCKKRRFDIGEQCAIEYQTQCVTEYQTQCVTEYQTQCVTEYQIPLSERHGFLDFRHTSPTDTGLRQW